MHYIQDFLYIAEVVNFIWDLRLQNYSSASNCPLLFIFDPSGRFFPYINMTIEKIKFQGHEFSTKPHNLWCPWRETPNPLNPQIPQIHKMCYHFKLNLTLLKYYLIKFSDNKNLLKLNVLVLVNPLM